MSAADRVETKTTLRAKGTALMLIDVINDLAFPGARSLIEQAEPMAIRTRDYFVLKPKHSGFFGTTLDALLGDLGIRRVILTGIAGNICVLFTANDAYMRGLRIFAPSDCIVSNTLGQNESALEQLHTVLKADIRPSLQLIFKREAIAKGER